MENREEQLPLPEGPAEATEQRKLLPADKYSVGPVSRFLAGLAGYDLYLLPQYAGPEIEHERRKLVRIGASVGIPAVLGFFTAFLFLSPYVESLPVRLIGALLTSLFILWIDCVIVTTLMKSSRFGTVVRLLISVCLGFVIAEPLLNSLYAKTINAHITTKLHNERTDRESRYKADLKKYEDDTARINRGMSEDQARLERYSTGNIALEHFRQAAARKDELSQGIHAQKSQEIDRLTARKKQIFEQRQAKQKEIESKLIEMQAEREGRRSSKTPGRGSVYSLLQSEWNRLTAERQALDEQIIALERSSTAVLNDRTELNNIESQFIAVVRPSGSPESSVLTPEEQGEKRRLEAQLESYRASLAIIQSQQKLTALEMQRLPQDFTLSTRDDSLAQTAALYEVLAENWFLKLKVTALFLMLFLADVTPVLVKLTVKTGYDDYLQSLAREQLIRDAASRDAFHQSLTTSIERNITRLMSFCIKATYELSRSQPDPSDSDHVNAIRERIGRAVERYTDELIQEARDVRQEKKQPGLIAVVSAGIRNTLQLIKTKVNA